MTLSNLLSNYKPGFDKDSTLHQVDTFIDLEIDEDADEIRLPIGKPVILSISKIVRNYFCKECGDIRSFSSQDTIYGTALNKFEMSVHFSCYCIECNKSVHIYTLVVGSDEIYHQSPTVEIRKYIETFPSKVSKYSYGEFSRLVEMADLAYSAGFTLGAIAYLRQVYEKVTRKAAENLNIDVCREDGKRRKFAKLLEEVDKEIGIVPTEFSAHGYKLFSELSELLHNECGKEITSLKFHALFRLTVGVVENWQCRIQNLEATESLGW